MTRWKKEKEKGRRKRKIGERKNTFGGQSENQRMVQVWAELSDDGYINMTAP
jgi:hypothetical protein